jgi:hypothetical protein
MKKLPLLFALIFGIIFSANAQSSKEVANFNSFQKSITFDITGKSITRGLKFDMRLKRGQRNGYGFKLGLARFTADGVESFDNQTVSVFAAPIEVNYIFGKKRHGLVTGIGAIPTIASSSFKRSINGSTLKGESIDLVGGFFTIGYRFTPLKKGITVQVNHTPSFFKDEIRNTFTSISIGYAFK